MLLYRRHDSVLLARDVKQVLKDRNTSYIVTSCCSTDIMILSCWPVMSNRY